MINAAMIGIAVLMAPAILNFTGARAQNPEFPHGDPFAPIHQQDSFDDLREDAVGAESRDSGSIPVPDFQAEGASIQPTIFEEIPENEPAAPTVAMLPVIIENPIEFALNNIVLTFCAVLVFLMIAGFSMVESGFNASKQTVNILFKNSLDLCLGLLLFWAIGFGMMFPTEGTNPPEEVGKYLSFGGIGVPTEIITSVDEAAPSAEQAATAAPASANPRLTSAYHPQSRWLFHAALAIVAATIVSGAMGGRMKFGAYLIYTAFLTAVIYPVSGFWAWGGGWLDRAGFHDFAGATVVHCVGGFAGLAGAIVLGPRLGRYTSEGRPLSIPGHSLPLATLGMFLLMIGWYGFHFGHLANFHSPDQIHQLARIGVNTALASAGGGIMATFLSWILFSKPDLSMALNGILAGLVAVSAGCDLYGNSAAAIIGGIAGLLVVGGVIALDKMQIDDPVGASSVHGLCGIWGCLAVAFAADTPDGIGTVGAQFQVILVICAWSFGSMYMIFSMLHTLGLLRVRSDDEQKGLDVVEHGMNAYAA